MIGEVMKPHPHVLEEGHLFRDRRGDRLASAHHDEMRRRSARLHGLHLLLQHQASRLGRGPRGHRQDHHEERRGLPEDARHLHLALEEEGARIRVEEPEEQAIAPAQRSDVLRRGRGVDLGRVVHGARG